MSSQISFKLRLFSVHLAATTTNTVDYSIFLPGDSSKIALKGLLDHREGHLKTSSTSLLQLCAAGAKCSELSGTLGYEGNSTIVIQK